jgi:hypothetical protein
MQFIKTSWFSGKPIQFGEYYINSGKPYWLWRLGPIMLRVWDEGRK